MAHFRWKLLERTSGTPCQLSILLRTGDTPLRPGVDGPGRPMGGAPCGDHLRTTLLQWIQKTKLCTQKRPREVCRPNQGASRSYPSRLSLYRRTPPSEHKGRKHYYSSLKATTKRYSKPGILRNQILLLPFTLTELSGVFFYPAPLD